MKRSTYVHKVRFADCDPARIVFYPRFFEIFDRATEEMFRQAGMDWSELFGKDGMNGLPLVDASARFRSPSRFGDTLEVQSWIDEIPGKVFVVLHEIRNDGILAVEGREVRVWAMDAPDRPQGIRAIPMPQEARDKLGC